MGADILKEVTAIDTATASGSHDKPMLNFEM